MILTNNMIYLKKDHLWIWNALMELEQQEHPTMFTSILTKSGSPSLFIEDQGKQIYLHSKYDPINEAEQWMRQYEDEVNEKEHIFFYGIGFGYHIEYLMHKFPDKTFTLYEPNPLIFNTFLCKREMKVLPLKKMRYLFVEFQISNAQDFFGFFIQQQIDSFIIIPHPIYERVYEQQTKTFFKTFKNILFGKREDNIFNLSVGNFWTNNCINNFKKVLETPNILREKRNFLQMKPVLLVAAGPSLVEDIELIRSIKEKGLAYIFAVGSANKALLSYGIYPDVVTSFDPFEHNILVFDEIIKQQIDSIPLIFGTSIDFKTVNMYPGPKIHLIIESDHISTYYLQEENMLEKDEIIPPEVNISTITLNLIQKLGCELVILTGQNFAFLGKQYYAEGVQFNYRIGLDALDEELTEHELVESVDGMQIRTMLGFNQGRMSMEKFLSKSRMEVINTTKGGAKIAGTVFMGLDKVINDRLTQSVVDAEWYNIEKSSYNKSYLFNQVMGIEKHYQQIPKIITNFKQIFKKMNHIQNTLNQKTHLEMLANHNNEMVSLMYELEKNSFYYAYIKRDMYNEVIQLNNIIESGRFSKNVMGTIRANLTAHINFINKVASVYEKNKELFVEFQRYLLNYIQLK